ncbi:hypothetical protein LPC08_24470 (plasmid) [Roseomonas sp. OT10]|uniref:hypothetical protein n=1 Tax=Roseomonas cutis TaxID=2897332 RepID=UPI001E4E5526|nr:hypothetical protein [Roseomonas sp. OT10]UFN51678.1 hypothetical protein LPC08_24470 [Roseomonas sp. OT10]
MAIVGIVLTANPGRRVRRSGFKEISLSLSRPAPRRHLDVQGLAGIAEAVAAFGHDVLAVNPGVSFDISVSMRQGRRKPCGFDAAVAEGRFGTEAFLRDDVGEEALYRALTDPGRTIRRSGAGTSNGG